MDGIGAVTQRIAQISSQIAAVTPAAPAVVATTSSGSSTAFAGELARAVSGSTAASAGAASSSGAGAAAAPRPAWAGAATASGRLTADGVPVELARFGNGKIPASQLAEIGRGDHRMWAPAAAAFRSMEAAAARDGVRIGVTDSYRSYEAQVDVARRKGLYSEGGLAAKPGTSDHGWGRSLDLDLNSAAQRWMRANADRFGFVEDVPREPWHWTFTPPR